MEERELRAEATSTSDGSDDSVLGVTAVKVTAKWNPRSDEPTLDNVSFSVKSGQLLGVIGPVGAGKVTKVTSLFPWQHHS
jgi:ABC-type protease/lipase transport system fused ATPase/permease subunit